MQIKSKEIKLVPIDELIPNPKNANRHSIEQIKRLVKLIEFQGFRNPLVISNRTGFIVAGHGRLEAARLMNMKEVPCDYQDFKDEAQEYAYLISDNEIARWAELDFHSVYAELEDLELSDMELLGLERFTTIAEEIELPDLGDGSDLSVKQVTFTLSNGQADILDDALAKIKKESECYDEINENKNGNALAEIMRRYVC